jgi:hypothetical protein
MKERNYGIDIFKMFAMYLVCVLHVLGQGGVVISTEKFSANYVVAWGLTLFAYTSVNCFALASGYVGYKAKFRPRKIIELYFIVLFYGIVFLALFSAADKNNFGFNNVLQAVFPSFSNTNPLYYWYFTAYAIMFMLMPFFNYVINKLERKKHAFLIVILLSLYCIIPAVMGTDYFHTTNGYSYLWLSALFIVGAYISKYKLFENVKTYKILIALALSLIITVSAHVLLNLYYTNVAEVNIDAQAEVLSNQFGIYSNFMRPSMFANYTFPTTVINSILLLAVFSKIKLKNKFLQNRVVSLVPLVFSVYIIHTNKFIFEQIIASLFEGYAKLNPVFLVLAVLGTALAIFVICIMIDMLRFELFKLIKVDKLCLFIENKLRAFWNRLFEKKEREAV